VSCKSTRKSTSHFLPLLQRRKPKGHGGQGKTTHQGKQHSTKEAYHSRVSFLSILSCAFDCNLTVYPSLLFSSLDLLPEEFFGTKEVPEYILADSSTKEENATPE
jgi:hypothetical protein